MDMFKIINNESKMTSMALYCFNKNQVNDSTPVFTTGYQQIQLKTIFSGSIFSKKNHHRCLTGF